MMDQEAGRPDVPECGRPFRPPPASGLRLTAELPAAVRRTEPVLTGSVDITSDRDVHAVIAPQVSVFAVRDGRVVTLPLPQDSVGVRLDLDAGQAVTLPAVGGLWPCDPSAEAGALVEPGPYELYALLLVSHDDGSSSQAVGGPWSVQVQ